MPSGEANATTVEEKINIERAHTELKKYFAHLDRDAFLNEKSTGTIISRLAASAMLKMLDVFEALNYELPAGFKIFVRTDGRKFVWNDTTEKLKANPVGPVLRSPDIFVEIPELYNISDKGDLCAGTMLIEGTVTINGHARQFSHVLQGKVGGGDAETKPYRFQVPLNG